MKYVATVNFQGFHVGDIVEIPYKEDIPQGVFDAKFLVPIDENEKPIFEETVEKPKKKKKTTPRRKKEEAFFSSDTVEEEVSDKIEE